MVNLSNLRYIANLSPVGLIANTAADIIRGSGTIDNSSGSMPVGNTYRGLGSSFFNAEEIAREDWLRDKQMMDYANSFSASQAQLQRDFEERMSNTAYQRAVEDMKKAGINPVLAYQLGGADVPSSSAASSSMSSASRSSSGNNIDSQILAGIFKIVAGSIDVGSASGSKKFNSYKIKSYYKG